MNFHMKSSIQLEIVRCELRVYQTTYLSTLYIFYLFVLFFIKNKSQCLVCYLFIIHTIQAYFI